ncbi:MAG: translation initiation factor IF-3 [Clostridia bacterium]|nr:translation initiation factor IF-3 [Clostridia bacterium]
MRPHIFILRRYNTIKELQINEQIRDSEIRLLNVDGDMVGIVNIKEAQRTARDMQLDLVKISPNANPPVCKIMDYGKFRYEQIKKEKELKRNQKIVELKEVQLSMTIDDGDLQTKMKNARKFIAEGNKVKVSLRMKGRQIAFAKNAEEVVKKFGEMLSDVATVEKMPLLEGKNIKMILAPVADKKKSK